MTEQTENRQTEILKKPNQIMGPIPSSREAIYRQWVEFLTPYHHLAKREKDALAVILRQRDRIASNCDNQGVLRDLLWSQTSRSDMRDSLQMSAAHFQIVIGKLKAKGIINDGIINPRFIPRLDPNSRIFEMRIIFYMKDGNESGQDSKERLQADSKADGNRVQ